MTPFFAWRIRYDDGTVLTEQDAAERGFRAVDLGRVRAIDLIPSVPGMMTVTVAIDAPAMRPILFRRVVEGVPVTCVGWQRTVRGLSVKSYTWVLPDGAMVVTDHDPGTMVPEAVAARVAGDDRQAS